MEENKDYLVNRFGDNLKPGKHLIIDHDVSCKMADISSLIIQEKSVLEAMRQKSVEGEKKVYEIVMAAVKQWEPQAALTQSIDRALEYLRIPEVRHTANQWQTAPNHGGWDEISNKVYRMCARIYEYTKYDSGIKKQVPYSWDVSWDVSLNTPRRNGIVIAGQSNKKYSDKSAAIKYLEGRKKAYSHLFTEISPAVPKEYAEYFKLYGELLPGYTVEGQEPAKDGHTAKALDGAGAVHEKQEKTSVLEKLSGAKTQEKTSPATEAADKKKEDVQR